MTTLYIVVGIIVAILILNPLVILLLPHSVTGKAVLKRELSKQGVITAKLPKACLADMVRRAEEIAKERVAAGQGENFHNTFIAVLAELGKQAGDFIKQPSRKDKSEGAELLRKHGV